MGLSYNVYLNANRIFGCRQCKTHLADYEDIISRVSRFSPVPLVHLKLLWARSQPALKKSMFDVVWVC